MYSEYFEIKALMPTYLQSELPEIPDCVDQITSTYIRSYTYDPFEKPLNRKEMTHFIKENMLDIDRCALLEVGTNTHPKRCYAVIGDEQMYREEWIVRVTSLADDYKTIPEEALLFFKAVYEKVSPISICEFHIRHEMNNEDGWVSEPFTFNEFALWGRLNDLSTFYFTNLAEKKELQALKYSYDSIDDKLTDAHKKVTSEVGKIRDNLFTENRNMIARVEKLEERVTKKVTRLITVIQELPDYTEEIFQLSEQNKRLHSKVREMEIYMVMMSAMMLFTVILFGIKLFL